MKATNRFLAILAVALGLQGCAGTPLLSQDQVLQKYPAIATLDQAVHSGQENNVDLLAPGSFTTASNMLANAYASAKKDRVTVAANYAKQGLDAISQANSSASRSSELLSDVLVARNKAIAAGALELYAKELGEIEMQLRSASENIENGNVEQAKQDRPELLKAYVELELMAVKEGTVKRAKLAIAHARDNDAHKLAPKTFKNAEDSLAASIAELDADRTARERAEAGAQRAYLEAVHSEHISELVRDYERRDFTQEDIVLWYQDQLANIASPLNKQLSFAEANKKTVSDLSQDITSLVEDRQRLTAAITAQETAEAKVAKLQQTSRQEIDQLQLEQHVTVANLKKGFAGEKAQLTQAQMEQEARFKRIQQMFSKDEATVYRQGDNVLISVRGFKFPPGSSEIESKNFSTMNKIVDAIATFSSPSVQVGGHTDITGSDQANLKLSQQRAQGVGRFLVDVGQFPADRLITEGFGSERPVSSNATPEGRAANRRIEVLIVNDHV